MRMNHICCKEDMNIVLILVSVLLNSAAQMLMRKGMLAVGEVRLSNLLQMVGPMLANVWLWLSMLCYAVSILLWMAVLSKVEVSYAYPFLSVGYIVAAVGGYYFFGEGLSLVRLLGIGVICLGVFLISRS